MMDLVHGNPNHHYANNNCIGDIANKRKRKIGDIMVKEGLENFFN
jgi:hypothetical protein